MTDQIAVCILIEKVSQREYKVWSTQYIECVQCHSTKYKYMAKGLCQSCYLREYRNDPKNKDRIKAQKDNWYRKKDRRLEKKLHREQVYFNGQREAALTRDNFRCCICSGIDQLVVHHKDYQGRNSKTPNNDLNNLITLCRACHAREHGTNKYWARHWKQCRLCNTTKHKHQAKGYCTRCYWHATSKDMVCSSGKLEEG